LRGRGLPIDFNTSIAELLVIHRREIENKVTVSPEHVFLLAFKILQIAGQTNNIRLIAKPAFIWLCEKWACILNQQRFLLRTPSVYEKGITQACNTEVGSYLEKLINLLLATLPTLGIRDQSKFKQILNNLQKTQY